MYRVLRLHQIHRRDQLGAGHLAIILVAQHDRFLGQQEQAERAQQLPHRRESPLPLLTPHQELIRAFIGDRHWDHPDLRPHHRNAQIPDSSRVNQFGDEFYFPMPRFLLHLAELQRESLLRCDETSTSAERPLAHRESPLPFPIEPGVREWTGYVWAAYLLWEMGSRTTSRLWGTLSSSLVSP